MCKKRSILFFVASLISLAILPVSMSIGEQQKPIKVGLVSSTTGYISAWDWIIVRGSVLLWRI